MAGQCGPTYILSELPDITSVISYPLQCTQRIKYTCFDVSKSLLVFGATSGGLYIFNRDPCAFVQLIPNKEGAVTHVRISPDEKRAAFATAKGLLCVCDCGEAGNGSYVRSPILQTSKQHQGNEITSIIWNQAGNEVFMGDDTGAISLLHLSSFITASVFQASAFPLMHLDSRIVQLDFKHGFLLVSTLTRSFVCDTNKEQYKQIGQKPRDGEFGSCFYCSTRDQIVRDTETNAQRRDAEYNVVAEGDSIAGINDSNNYMKVFSARPGSRIWECKMDGTVVCTHQFKSLLATPPAVIVSANDFETQHYDLNSNVDDTTVYDPQSFNFQKLQMLINKFILTYKRDGLYIFDPRNASVVLWSNKYSGITDVRIIDGLIYVWSSTSYLVTLSFATIEKFLLKCYVNDKFVLCGKIISSHLNLILNLIPQSKKLHLISPLGEKLQDLSEDDLYEKTIPALEEMSKYKKNCVQKLKSGIFVVDNSYLAKVSSMERKSDFDESDTVSKTSSEDSESMLFQISPDALQALKGFSNTVTDKLTSSTKTLKKTWDHLEDKMKKIGLESYRNEPLDVRTPDMSPPEENAEHSNVDVVHEHDDIVVNRPSRSVKSSGDRSPPADKLTKTLYHHVKLSDINKLDYSETTYKLISGVSCDIKVVHGIIKQVEEYMLTCGEQNSYSAYYCGKLLLQYIDKTPNVDETINSVIEDETVCSYFLEAFVNINSKMDVLSSCECGYPLPNAYSSKTPLFSNLIDIFIEKRWSSSQSEQCYDICKKVPYMWRKILILRKNEDLLNLVFLILQLLDENLLYSYLPHFTVDVWKKAIGLLCTLRNSECLNCGRKFQGLDDAMIQSNLLSWDLIGGLIIKSVGCGNAIQILKDHSSLIAHGDLTIKFYHTCIFVKLFEKYDGTITAKLVDTLYEAYDFPDALQELSEYLHDCLKDDLQHTALPLSVASKSPHWGLKVVTQVSDSDIELSLENKVYNQPDLIQSINSIPTASASSSKATKYKIGMTLEQTLDFLGDICANKNCHHCCLPLESRVLIADGGLWVFSCGHTFHGVCLTILKIKLCPMCYKTNI